MQESEDDVTAQPPPKQRVVQVMPCPAGQEDKDDEAAGGCEQRGRSRSKEGKSKQAGLREEGEREKETGPVTERWIGERDRIPMPER